MRAHQVLRTLAVSSLLVGCYVPREKVAVRVEVPPELRDQAALVAVLPRIAEAHRTVRRGAVTLELKREAGKVRLELPGACPVVIDTRSLTANEELRLEPLFDIGPPERLVGLGRRFELSAVARCPEADAAHASFEIEGGAALEDVQRGERRFAATTREAVPERAPDSGIVPVSARVAQGLRTELKLRIELPGGQRFEQRLGVSAVARSNGLPDVGLRHPVLISGEGWRLRERPHDSTAELQRAGRLLELLPDRAGRYRLQNSAGESLTLHSARYDETPLDCGSCHTEIAQSALASPMAQALALDLGGCHTLSTPECATACHSTGEPGTLDGGFAHVMAELGTQTLPAEYDDLPHALRRLGGVGCAACHGPGLHPQPAGRAALSKNEVCAVCHDAPPRYGHLQALASSAMGRADAAPATRKEPCARCHTTSGALGHPSPELHAPQAGLGCVTCHDVHPHGAALPALSHAGLLRRLPLPPSAATLPSTLLGVSRVCVSCHAPDAGTERPFASTAAILAGQGGWEPRTGVPLELPSPHTTSPRGCLSCHDSGPSGLLLGQSHGFLATSAACAKCHQTPPARNPNVAARARALLERLAPDLARAEPGTPWHARPAYPTPEEARGRALRNVLLVLEDPAADVHHPRYAQALLEAAAAQAP